MTPKHRRNEQRRPRSQYEEDINVYQRAEQEAKRVYPEHIGEEVETNENIGDLIKSWRK